MKKMKKIKHIVLLFWLLLLAGVSGCTLSEPAAEAKAETVIGDAGLTVHFLNVGQGNAVLLESDGSYMLVDGGVNAASSYVISYLQKQGVEGFDYVIATHYDADHLAGLVGVLHVFPVDTVMGPDYQSDTKLYQSFLTVLKQLRYQLVFPRQGEVYQLGSATFTIVGPVRYRHSDGNEDSIAIRVTCGKNSFLLAGDAGIESENEMVESGIELKSDVYLVNHHGSETSTGQLFLDAVDPKYAVISSNTEGNQYGHPRQSVLERLKKQQVELFRTDLQGEIVISSDGDSLSYEKQPCNDFTPGMKETLEVETTVPAAMEQPDYILNPASMKFHLPVCKAVKRMKEKNRTPYQGKAEELLEQGYQPCRICLP